MCGGPRNRIWDLWRPRESKSQDQQYRTLSGLRHRMAVASRPTAESSGRFSHRTKSVASRPTAESSSRSSRALDNFGTVRGDFGNRHLATSVSLGRKGVQETCTNSTSPPSGRSVFPDTSTEPLSVRHTHSREGTVSSFRILGKVSEDCAWNDNNEAAGREEPRDPRSPETLEVASGTGECDRVPLGKASGARSAGQ